jgi:eukaryotic-like serine/threonine-protein kinase
MTDTVRALSKLRTRNSVLPRGGRDRLADLAFGSLSLRAGTALTTDGIDPGRHLAFLPSDALQLDLGNEAQRRFGDYELLELIGEGGMGVVYRARQISLDREVAVKLLSAGPWSSRDFVERFQREAQNAARMQHPNIVAIHEVGAVDELHYFSMRLVRGQSLAEEIRRDGRLPALRAATLLRTVAEAVDYAHRLDVLHLDLKPANVLLDEDGTPHVADFGLARRLEQGLADDSTEISGTPSYMAPEQVRFGARKITPATDIWGLGAILYELVTGKPPFAGLTVQGTLKLVAEGRPESPRQYAPGLPRDLEALIRKCMTRDVAGRYASARDLADDLENFIEGRPVRARPLNRMQRIDRWARREPRTAGLLLLVLVALLAGLFATAQQWQAAQRNAKLASERLWQSRIDQAAIALRNGHSYDALPLLAANIAEREAQGLDAHEDRVRIAMAERSAPRLIDIVPTGAEISGIAITPDGGGVAVATKDYRIQMFDTATGERRWVSSFKGATHAWERRGSPIRLEQLKFSADGRYLVGRNRGGDWLLLTPVGGDEILFDSATGKVLVPPAERVPDFVDATFSPDGRHALVRSRDAHAVFMRTSDWHALGTPKPFAPSACILANGGQYLASSGGLDDKFTALALHDARSLAVLHRFAYSKEQALSAWATTPDGKALVVGHWDGRVEYIDFASGKREDVRPSPMARIGRITFSPDGRWFGAVADSGDVLVWDTATRQLAAQPIRLDVKLGLNRDNVGIDAASRVVLASSELEMALWHLPVEGAPVRLSGQFPHINAFGSREFSLDAAHALIATDGGGAGELRLWRMQPIAPIGRRGAPLRSPELQVGDGRVVGVDRNRVTVVAANDGRALGPTLEMAQTPTFAELTADSASLVVAVGPTLAVYDTATWTLRHEPIALPNDPARVVPSPDSRHVLLMFADYANGRSRELAQMWDLEAGKPTSAPLAVDAATRARFSPDGRALLVWRADDVGVVDALTLRPRWPGFKASVRLAAAEPELHVASGAKTDVTAARFSRDGSRFDFLSVTGLGAANIQNEETLTVLWHVDATTGDERGHALLRATNGGPNDFAAMPDRSAFVVQRMYAGPVWWDDVRGARQLGPLAGVERLALALAPDATMFAHANTAAVGLVSTRSLQWLSPVMPASLPQALDYDSEYLAQLALAADGSTLVGRSRRNVWLRWNVTPDQRAADRLAREAALLSGPRDTAGGLFPPPLTAAERRDLREQDDGPFSLHAVDGRADVIAPRRPDASADLVDLGAARAAVVGDRTFDELQYELPTLAPGLHRFLGVDYDVRARLRLEYDGATVDATKRAADKTGTVRRVEGIRPGIARFAALDVLANAPGVLRRDERGPYAYVEIAYRDGGRERLPILYLSDMGGGSVIKGNGEPSRGNPRIAWRAIDAGPPQSGSDFTPISAVRLVNPHPEREVASLALEAVPEPNSTPDFYAITLEPLAAAHADPGADESSGRR